MQNLPTAEVYERENRYTPWGILMKEIQESVFKEAPKGATVLDLLCGPGYLLGQIQSQRPDLRLTGVDLESEFIEFARKQYTRVDFIVADAAEWKAEGHYDVIVCTGGLHHLPYEQQEPFLQKIASLIADGGFAIIADPYIGAFSDELSRKLASAKLGYEYLVATMRNGADEEVIRATVGILMNDVLLVEYKSSIQKMKPLFEKYFSKVVMRKTWPAEESDFGDYYFILRK
jgi:2-polyprenyl-3-methyl-5-hydroxy-6-metoxy-1,4-benzoquinol methylase